MHICLDDKPETPNNKEEDDEEDFDWQIEQQPYTEEDVSVEGPKYGFAHQRSGVLKRLQVRWGWWMNSQDTPV